MKKRQCEKPFCTNVPSGSTNRKDDRICKEHLAERNKARAISEANQRKQQ